MLAKDADPEFLIKLVSFKMPFGKFKGVSIAELPSSYLSWFMKQSIPSGELGQMLITMYEIDRNGLRYLLKPLITNNEVGKFNE